MDELSKIKQFFTSPSFAVIGASDNRNKFGNKMLRCYLQHHKTVYPVNPHEQIIEGLQCMSQLQSLPQEVKSTSIVTPPAITEQIIEQVHLKGIENIWMQPGAESVCSIQKGKQFGMNVIADGHCLLVILGFKE